MIPGRGSKAWAVFISGRGSNLQALLDLGAGVDIRRVYSSRARAPGVRRARRAGVGVTILSNPIDWGELHRDLLHRRIDRVFLAGFMKIVPADFVRRWEGRIFNVHPSLLPSYPGLRAFERSWDEGADVGATVHEVIPELDAGPVVLQRRALESESIESRRRRELADGQRALSLVEQTIVRECVLRKGRSWI